MDSDVEEADDSFYVFRGHTGEFLNCERLKLALFKIASCWSLKFWFVFGVDELYTVACSPIDESLVASGGKDDRGFLWRIGSETPLLELQGDSFRTFIMKLSKF